MDNPREFSEEDFLKYEAASPAKRIELVKEADKDRPEYTAEELAEIKKYEESRTYSEIARPRIIPIRKSISIPT